MPSTGQADRAIPVDSDSARRRPLHVLARLGWSHRDAVGFAIGVLTITMVLVNVLFLQPGPHPAPMVRSGIGSAVPVPTPVAEVPGLALAGATASLPRPRPIELSPPNVAASKAPALKTEVAKSEVTKVDRAKAEPTPPARTNAEILVDIQRELARRGYYDGTIDGRYGPKTDAAIRDFEQASGLRPSTEPNEALLRSIGRSQLKARSTTPAAMVRASAPPVPPAPLTRPDPIGEMLTPTRRVVAVQRALAEFGYGQINPSGVIDGETQAAIEKFERERKLPITGQISHRVVRELAAVTGRPLE